MSGRKLRMLLRKCFGEEQRSERAEDAHFCCFNTSARSRKDRRASTHLSADCKERGLGWPAGTDGRSGSAAAAPAPASVAATAVVAVGPGVGLQQIGAGAPMAEARRPTATAAATTKQGAACSYPPLIPISADGEVADYASSRRAVGRLCHSDPDSDNSCIRPPPNRTVFSDFSPPPPPSSRGRNVRAVPLRGDTCRPPPPSHQAPPGQHLSSARGDYNSVSSRPAAARKSSSASAASGGGLELPPPQYSDLFHDGSAAAYHPPTASVPTAAAGGGPGTGCQKPMPT